MKILKYGLVLLFSVTLWGCGKGNSASVVIDPSTGKHPAGWAVGAVGGTHVDKFLANPASCKGCHGEATAPLSDGGGISKVSCSSVSRDGMNCHGGVWPHGDVPFIPQAFDTPTVHGTQVVNKGLALCQKCHGFDYKGLPGLGVSCIACHKLTNPANNAPHAFDWTTGTLRHSATNQKFAPTCGECHLGGLLRTTPVPLPAGIPTPTCFGTTALCHSAAGHAIPYIDPADHGVAAHNAGPMSCASCHATGNPPSFTVNKNANLTPNGCENCHSGEAGATGLAHPYGWLPGRGGSTTTTHTTANSGAAGEQCSPCHALTGTNGSPSPNAPSCMTQTARIGGTTFCHFTAGPVANPTGCRSCHGTSTTNGQPDGAAAPNRGFRHAAHFAKLPGLTCAVCHQGKGTGDTLHSTIDLTTASTAAVVIPALAASPSYSDVGQGVYNGSVAGTCSNVSCHGAKFPAGVLYKWRNAAGSSLSGDADCVKCHTPSTVAPAVYAGPYIGPFSGYTSVIQGNPAGFQNLHDLHVSFTGIVTCVSCHNKTKVHSRMLLGKRDIRGVGFAQASLPASFKYTITSGTSNCSNVSCHADFNGTTSPARSWYKLPLP